MDATNARTRTDVISWVVMVFSNELWRDRVTPKQLAARGEHADDDHEWSLERGGTRRLRAGRAPLQFGYLGVSARDGYPRSPSFSGSVPLQCRLEAANHFAARSGWCSPAYARASPHSSRGSNGK